MTSFCLGWSGKIGGAGLGIEVEVEAGAEAAGRGGDVDGDDEGEVAIIRNLHQTMAVACCQCLTAV